MALNPNGANAGVKAIGHIDPNGGGKENAYGACAGREEEAQEEAEAQQRLTNPVRARRRRRRRTLLPPLAGSDFKHQGKKWTVALCQLDSDGDGQTNGFELGDICCTWKVGQAVNVTTAISNPGDANSTSTRVCNATACSNGINPCVPHVEAASLRGAKAAH